MSLTPEQEADALTRLGGVVTEKEAEKPAEESGPSPEMDALGGMRAELEALNQSLLPVLESIVKEKRSAGDERPKDELIEEAANESPVAVALLDRINKIGERLGSIEEKMNAAEAATADSALEQEEKATQAYFGLSNEEMDKAMAVWERSVQKDGRASVLTVKEVLGRVYGDDFLTQRRSEAAIGRAKGGPAADGKNAEPARSSQPTARLVTDSSTGGGPRTGFKADPTALDFSAAKSAALMERFGIKTEN